MKKQKEKDSNKQEKERLNRVKKNCSNESHSFQFDYFLDGWYCADCNQKEI